MFSMIKRGCSWHWQKRIFPWNEISYWLKKLWWFMLQPLHKTNVVCAWEREKEGGREKLDLVVCMQNVLLLKVPYGIKVYVVLKFALCLIFKLYGSFYSRSECVTNFIAYMPIKNSSEVIPKCIVLVKLNSLVN